MIQLFSCRKVNRQILSLFHNGTIMFLWMEVSEVQWNHCSRTHGSLTPSCIIAGSVPWHHESQRQVEPRRAHSVCSKRASQWSRDEQRRQTPPEAGEIHYTFQFYLFCSLYVQNCVGITKFPMTHPHSVRNSWFMVSTWSSRLVLGQMLCESQTPSL